jgi:hypothetical protein
MKFLFRKVLVIVIVLLPLSAGAEEEVPIGINVIFSHSTQYDQYSTILSITANWRFSRDSAAHITATYHPDPGGCLATASWQINDLHDVQVGPVPICMTSADVSIDEFNRWAVQRKWPCIDPAIVFPLRVKEPEEFINTGQATAQQWVNAEPVTAKIFMRSCGDGQFLHYGDLFFDSGKLLFSLETDMKGDLQVAVSADDVFLYHDEETWQYVLTECDEKNILPGISEAGVREIFTGSSSREMPDRSTLSGKFTYLLNDLRTLAFQDLADKKTVRKLATILENASNAMRTIRPDKAVNEIEKFRNNLERFVMQGLIDQVAEEPIIAQANELEHFILDFPYLPPPAPVNYCLPSQLSECPDTLSACPFTVYHVDKDSTAATPDGSLIRPFRTISQAITSADKFNLCGVSLRVASGFYAEGDIHITRHTKIIGLGNSKNLFSGVFVEGSVTNTGPFYLELSNSNLVWFREEAADGLFVENPCASTRLEDVRIAGFRGFGIRHRGGSMSLTRTSVVDTRASDESLSHGTGILLNCGTRARMYTVTLARNETSGLIIAGPGTEVEALGIAVNRTRVHPQVVDPTYGNPWGAVHVRDDARLEAHGFTINSNWFFGVRVNTGGYAFLENGILSNTQGIERFFPGQGRRRRGGINAGAYYNGHLVMSDFVSTRAGLCAVGVAENGEINLRGRNINVGGDRRDSSEISRSPIGVCIALEEYDFDRMINGVAFRDNERNVDAMFLPLPDAAPPD